MLAYVSFVIAYLTNICYPQFCGRVSYISTIRLFRFLAVLPLNVQIEMLDRLRSFNVIESTVRLIKKSEDKIRSSVASTSLSAKIVYDPVIEKMGVALSLWIEDRNQKRVPLSGPMVREKAKRLYAHFKEPDGNCL
ncbi:hypothetical protein GQX74_003178 [Glossina fuscipes]|nr:hypothetical protein GQX74_003178 [Glossina fuscipes]